MRLRVERYNHEKDYTDGLLFIDDKFECFTIEDGFREAKVAGETRIPDGVYPITLRTEGGFHANYTRKFPDIHKGMLWVRDVPGFEYILIHLGNTSIDTDGCLLVGSTADKDKDFIGSSRVAYEDMYPKVAKALEAGEEVTIEFVSK